MRRVLLLATALLVPLTANATKTLPKGKLVEVGKGEAVIYDYQITQNGYTVHFPIVKVGNRWFGLEMEKTPEGFRAVPPKVDGKKVSGERIKGILDLAKDYVKPVGNGDKVLVVFFDVSCPYCVRTYKSGELERLKKDYKVYLIPLPVHGKVSNVGDAYYLKLAKEKGVEGALKETLGKTKMDNLKDWVGTTTVRYMGIKEDLSKEQKLLKDLYQREKGLVEGTPTFVVCDPQFKECVMYLGQLPERR